MTPTEQWYYIRCALVNAQPAGTPELIGVYTVTEDEDYAAPADASLIIWNVPAQTGDRTITFTGELGQEAQLLVINSNGFNVEEVNGAFSLNDTAPYVVNVRRSAGTNDVVLSDGTAAQYDVGTSGSSIGLLNGNWIKTGTTEFQGNVEMDGASRLYFGSTLGPYWVKNAGFDFVDLMLPGGALFQMGTADFGYGVGSAIIGGQPAGTGRYVIRSNAGLGLRLEIMSDAPIEFYPNSVYTGDIRSSGWLIATGGTGGSRVAKWLPGKATLAAGTVAVSDTSVTAGSVVLLTAEGTPTGAELGYTINPGVGFTINSSNGADVRTISYQRIVLG